MKRNLYLYKIAINDHCQNKRNEVKESTQGQNTESAITAHLNMC